MSGRLIVVEGNNGTGKSTAAAHLRDGLPAALFHYPEAFTRFRRAVDMDVRVGPLANLTYHLAATLHLADLVRERRAAGDVVCDRYLPGPLSLLEARGLFRDEELQAWIAPYREAIPAPDRTVLLTADHATACRRIRERAAGGELRAIERQVLESAAFFARREDGLRRHAARLGPVTEIDTTELTAEETCRRVREAVG